MALASQGTTAPPESNAGFQPATAGTAALPDPQGCTKVEGGEPPCASARLATEALAGLLLESWRVGATSVLSQK